MAPSPTASHIPFAFPPVDSPLPMTANAKVGATPTSGGRPHPLCILYLVTCIFSERIALSMNSITNKLSAQTISKILLAIFSVALPLFVASSSILSYRLNEMVNRDDRPVEIEAGDNGEFQVFSMEYENDDGMITVSGMDGNRVVAPGTSGEALFRLKNVDDVTIDYTLEPKVVYTSEFTLPILMRLIRPDGTYMAGDEETWIKAEEMNDIVADADTIPEEEGVAYVLQWKWDFESGDDDYDTLLGNEKWADVGIKVSFLATASANTSVEENGGFVESGALENVAWGTAAAALLGGLVALMIGLVKFMGPTPPPAVGGGAVPPPVAGAKPKKAPVTPPPASNQKGKQKEKKQGREAEVNLDLIANVFAPGERVNLMSLKAKGLVPPTAEHIKVLARNGGVLNKPLIVECRSISARARALVIAAGGTVINV